MTRTRHSWAATIAAILLASCSDDPAEPGGGASETAYQATFDFFGASVYSLWGTPTGEVYASGSSIMHYDGNAWEPITLPHADDGVLRTWGDANGNLYATGETDMHRYDGTEWHRIPRPAQVRDIWGADNGEIFVVGGGNHRLYHYDGATWFVDSLKTNSPWDPWAMVSGANPDDVHIAGDSGWIGHFDGVRWNASRVDSTLSFQSIWQAPDGPLYLATMDSVFTYDGDELAPVDLGMHLWGPLVFGRSANEVYCSGESDYPTISVLRYDGTEWSKEADIEGYLSVVWGDRSSNRLFAGGNAVWSIEGGAATPSLGNPAMDRNEFMDLWGNEEVGVYLIGSRAYRYHEGTWTDLKKQDLTTAPAYSIWGRSSEEIYAVGPGLIFQYDGASWTAVSGGAHVELNAIDGNQEEIFAVGWRGAIARHDGNAWTTMESGTTDDLYAVYAWKDGAFAGGDNGTLLRYDGSEWRPFPSPVPWAILDMFGFGPQSIFAVGSSSTEICRFDGRAWTPIFIGYTRGANHTIWGTSEQDLFLGQGRGDVLHFDGSSWSYLPRVTTRPVIGVWGAPGGEIIAATRDGVVRYHR